MKVLYLSFVVVLIDQISKFVIKGISIPFLGIHLSGMNYAQSIDVIGSFFKITFVENPGMAFGISVGIESKLFLSLFSLFASIGLIYYLYKVRHTKLVYRIALALIIAGAVGNLIDRTFYGIIYGYAPIFYGRVVDFFNVDFFNLKLFGHYYNRFPIFNIADSSVTVGVFLLLFVKRTTNKQNDDDSSKDDVKKSKENTIGLKESVDAVSVTQQDI